MRVVVFRERATAYGRNPRPCAEHPIHNQPQLEAIEGLPKHMQVSILFDRRRNRIAAIDENENRAEGTKAA